MPTRRTRKKRLRRGDPPADWGWIIERLRVGHPEMQRAVWWVRVGLSRYWPSTPDQARAVVQGLLAIIHHKGLPPSIVIEACRAVMEADWRPIRLEWRIWKAEQRPARQASLMRDLAHLLPPGDRPFFVQVRRNAPPSHAGQTRLGLIGSNASE